MANNPNNLKLPQGSPSETSIKSNFAQIIAKYQLTVPTVGYSPGILQVFYSHGGLPGGQGGLTLEKAIELFGDLADYSLDGTGSGPSLFLREIS